MKKIAILFLSLGLLTACVNDFEYKPEHTEDLLILNATFRQDDSVHLVWMGISALSGIREIQNGQVRCIINGQTAATGVPLAPEEYEEWAFIRSRQKGFRIRADLKPGDKVVLEASADDGAFHARTEATVPQAAVIRQVDTSGISRQNEDYTWELVQFRIRLEDIRGEENGYMISAVRDGDLEVKNAGETVRSHKTDNLTLEYSDDPVLTDGAGYSFLDFDTETYREEQSIPFQDKLFRDEAVSLRVGIRRGMLDWPPATYEYTEGSAHFTRSVRLRIDASPLEDYQYLRAARTLVNEDYIPGIMEPVALPTNIEGGTGWFSIQTPVFHEIRLPDMDFDFDNRYYY